LSYENKLGKFKLAMHWSISHFTKFLSFFFTAFLANATEIPSIDNLPFDRLNLQSSYLLDNGNEIYIEQFERGDRIWEYNSQDQSFKELTFVWNFIGLAKHCESINEKNIYFANNLEYYLGGGTNIDNPQIRIFSLNDTSPWRDSDLGIVPSMKWAKEYCEFY